MVATRTPRTPSGPSGGKTVAGATDTAASVRGGTATRNVAIGTDGASSGAQVSRTEAGRQIQELGGVTPNHPAVKEAAVDRALGTSFKILGPLSLGAWIGPPIANGIGRLTSWTGRKTGAKTIESAGARVQGTVKYFNETSLSQVGKSTRTGGFFGAVAQPIFNGAAAVTERLTRWTGLGSNRVAAHVGRMHQHLDLARELKDIDLGAAHPTVRPHLREMHEIVSSAATTGHIDMGRLSKAHAGFHEAIAKVHETQAPQSIAGTVSKATGKIKSAIGTVVGSNSSAAAVGTLHTEETQGMEAIAKSGAAAIGKFEKAVGRAVGHHHSAEGWRNPAKAIKNLPHEMKGATLRKTAMEGSWIALSGLSLAAVARSFMKNWRDLKNMQEDISGSKPSTIRLLIGNVAGPVAKARSHLLKTFFAREAVETVGLVVNVKQVRGGHISPIALGVQFAGSQAVDGIMGESIVPVYQALSDLHKKGEAISVEAYAALIGQASPEIKARGGVESPFAKELAKQYAAEKASPAQIMKDIDDGSLMVRVHKIIEEHKKPQTASHAKRLEGGAAAEREAIGKHTDQLNKQTASERGLEGASPAV